MAKSYQLVAWTDKGQVRMIPSQFKAYLSEEIEHLNRINDQVRYGTYHEVSDLLKVSNAYEKLASGLSQKTVRDILVVLKMILRYGAKHGLMEMHQIYIVFPTERERQDIEVLTITNQRQLMTYVKEHFTFLNLGIFNKWTLNNSPESRKWRMTSTWSRK